MSLLTSKRNNMSNSVFNFLGACDRSYNYYESLPNATLRKKLARSHLQFWLTMIGWISTMMIIYFATGQKELVLDFFLLSGGYTIVLFQQDFQHRRRRIKEVLNAREKG